MDGIKAVGSFIFGDSKAATVDTQKLKSEILSAFDTIDGFLNLKEILNKTGILLTCKTCWRGQKIQNPKSVLFVASHQNIPLHQQEPSHFKKAERRDSKGYSPVDRSQRKVDKVNKVHALNYPTVIKGDDSDDDKISDESDDKIDQDNQFLKDELQQTEQKLKEAKEENSNLLKQIEEIKGKYDEELKSAATYLSKLTVEKERTDNSIKHTDSRLQRLDHEVSELKEELERKEKERKDCQNSLDALKRKVTESEEATNSKDEQIGSMTRKVTELEQKLELKDGDFRSLEQRVEELLSDNSSKGGQIEFISSELRLMQRLIEDERMEHKSLKATLEEEILGLKANLTAWEERSKNNLAVPCPPSPAIERCLKERCQSDKVTLEVKQYKSPDKTPGPILVLCMNVSRLGTDVKEALKGTPGNFEVLVVVLHHKEVHALPSQASDRVLTGEEYKQLGAIVDAAFWTGKGMYDCELNKLATEKIYNFVSGFGTR